MGWAVQAHCLARHGGSRAGVQDRRQHLQRAAIRTAPEMRCTPCGGRCMQAAARRRPRPRGVPGKDAAFVSLPPQLAAGALLHAPAVVAAVAAWSFISRLISGPAHAPCTNLSWHVCLVLQFVMQLIKDIRRLDTTPALNLVCMCV